jgi:hypothetical protein
MRPRASKAPSTDLDLRIKAGSALTCDLSGRVYGADVSADPSASRPDRSIDLVFGDTARHPWVRPVLYAAFTLAIAIPWVLLLSDQLAG